MLNRVRSSPILARVTPFAAFVLLTFVQGLFGETLQYWLYALKTVAGAWLLWLVRPQVEEMRWRFSWSAVVVGVAVFAAWVGLDGHYPLLAQRRGTFNPVRSFGGDSPLAWASIGVRLIGSSLVVPPLEEVFYRSFLYRFIIRSDFRKIPLEYFSWKAFLLAGLIFGLGHYEWLPGILCAFAYQGLVCRKKRLGDAITAHAVTNSLLGFWVVTRNAWRFW